MHVLLLQFGQLDRAVFYGPGVVLGAVADQLLARTSSGGTTDWYLPDNLGSVRDIVNIAAVVQDHIVYDSFGNILTETNATNGDRFKFAGMQYDATTGQYYDHARDYNSGTGDFAHQEPTGFNGGGTNLYRYALSDPTDLVDISGLSPGGGNILPPDAAIKAQHAESIEFWLWMYAHNGLVQGLTKAQVDAMQEMLHADEQLQRAVAQVRVRQAAIRAAEMAGKGQSGRGSRPNRVPPTPSIPFPGNIPRSQPPGPGFSWGGDGPPGIGDQNWYNKQTKESLHYDMEHPPPIGPHWDYTN